MLMYKTGKIFIYYGDAQDGISKSLHCNPTNAKLVEIEPFKSVAQKINVPRLVALNQTHSIHGSVISDDDISFTVDGDYLVTNQINVGLGILTADCVPVILYDVKNHVIAAIHAGWRGTIAGIVPKAFEHMKTLWQSNADTMQVFIGPSAKACCYQVQEDFLQQVPLEFAKKVMIKKQGRWYFDTVQLIVLQMQEIGISASAINTNFNLCTMCDHRFFSHRRQAVNAGRQITVAKLL